MKIVIISDTHTHLNPHLPLGDILVHAGDFTSTGTPAQVNQFLQWFSAQPHRHKIFIAGNHDRLFEDAPEQAAQLLAEYPNLIYLQDSAIQVEGINFWGSPWQPEFNDWAFNLRRGGPRLREAWNRIPIDTDVLITHGPPHGILDQVRGGPHLGCEELKIRLAAVKPKVHVFGHIHDGFGVAWDESRLYLNASQLNEEYRPVNRPIEVEFTAEKVTVLCTEANDTAHQRLCGLKAALQAAEHTPFPVQTLQVQSVLHGMAALRMRSTDELTLEYIRRGLEADLARLERKEAKPSRQPIPVRGSSESSK